MKTVSTPMHYVLGVDNDAELTDLPDIANTIGQTFSNNSSSDNCTSKFNLSIPRLKTILEHG